MAKCSLCDGLCRGAWLAGASNKERVVSRGRCQLVNNCVVYSLSVSLILHAIDRSSDRTAPTRARLPARVPTRRATILLGVTLSNDFTWNRPVDTIVQKASKRIFMLYQLKQSGISQADMVTTYLTGVRPIVEYACPDWHTNLAMYLSDSLEGNIPRHESYINYRYTQSYWHYHFEGNTKFDLSEVFYKYAGRIALATSPLA